MIPTVESQINAMQQLRQGLRGADARDLLHVQTQYAEFCKWLYHDAGDFLFASVVGMPTGPPKPADYRSLAVPAP